MVKRARIIVPWWPRCLKVKIQDEGRGHCRGAVKVLSENGASLCNEKNTF